MRCSLRLSVMRKQAWKALKQQIYLSLQAHERPLRAMTTALGVSLHPGDSIEPPDACLKHVLKGLSLEMCGGIQQKETLEGETGAW